MFANWKCPSCGTTNSKPDYVLQLSRLAAERGPIHLTKTSFPSPRCSECGYEADVNEMLKGTFDTGTRDTPGQASKAQPLEKESRLAVSLLKTDHRVWIAAGVILVVLVCVGAIGTVAGITFANRNLMKEIVSFTPTSHVATLPSATATAPPLTRMPDPAEAQRLMEGKSPPFLARAAIESYTSEQLSQMSTVPYTVKWSSSEPLAWGMGWCTTTETILHENFEHILYTFILQGEEIPLDRFVMSEYYDEDMQGYCRQYYTILTDWNPGKVVLKTIITLDRPINDGWDDYAPGTKTYEYTIMVSR